MSSDLRALARTFMALKIPVKGTGSGSLQTALSIKAVLDRFAAADWVVASSAGAFAPKPRTFTLIENQGPGPRAPGGAVYVLTSRDPHFEGLAVKVEDGAPVHINLAPWKDSYLSASSGNEWTMDSMTRRQVARQLLAAANKLERSARCKGHRRTASGSQRR